MSLILKFSGVCSEGHFTVFQKIKWCRAKKHRIGRMNYIVNSCFEIEPQNTVDNGIRYLLGMEMQDCKVS